MDTLEAHGFISGTVNRVVIQTGETLAFMNLVFPWDQHWSEARRAEP